MPSLTSYHLLDEDDGDMVEIRTDPVTDWGVDGWFVPFFDRNYDALERIAEILNSLESPYEAEARLILAQAGLTRPRL